MLQAFGQLLPIALAYAISSVPITATIVLLLSPQRKRSTVPYVLGWVIGIFGLTTLCVLGAQAAPKPPRGQSQTVAVLEILLGIALLVLGAVTFRRHPEADEEGDHELPGWLQRLGSFGPVASFGVGLALNLRPKAVILAVAAGLALREGSLGGAVAIGIVIALFTAIAGSTVVLPATATLVAPQRWEPRLVAAQRWMVTHGSVVTVVIMVMIGVVILGKGLSEL